MDQIIKLLLISLSVIWMMPKIFGWMCIYFDNPLSYIEVTGYRQLTTNYDLQILMSQLETLGTFITQDVNVVQRHIAQLPWIKQVSVRKQWPDTLRIHVVEYEPKAYWNNDLVISTEGVIFRDSKNQDGDNNRNDNMPILYGSIDKAQDVLYNYLMFKKILKSSIFQIQSVTIDTCASWQLILKNDICLRLGRTNIVERLLYFIKIYPVLCPEIYEKNKHIDYIDLRYRSGVAIKWIDNSVISVF